ncbi:MAG: hypothetical protein M3O70_28230 [Actinomycetota bacterium]|nr:hypothetical protein [Actinomycetota bacterium]
MVGLYGMSSALGRLRLLTKGNHRLRGGEVAAASGETRQQFDREVKGLIVEAERTANMLLVRHRTELDAMAMILESAETLEGAALEGRLARIRNGRDASTYAQQYRGHPAYGRRLGASPSEQTTEAQHRDAAGWKDAGG